MPFQNERNYKNEVKALINAVLEGHQPGESDKYDRLFELNERIDEDPLIGLHLAQYYSTALLRLCLIPAHPEVEYGNTNSLAKLIGITTDNPFYRDIFFNDWQGMAIAEPGDRLLSEEDLKQIILRASETQEWKRSADEITIARLIPDPRNYPLLEVIPSTDWFILKEIDFRVGVPTRERLTDLGVNFQRLEKMGIDYPSLILMHREEMLALDPRQRPAPSEVRSQPLNFDVINIAIAFPIPESFVSLPYEVEQEFRRERAKLFEDPIMQTPIMIPATLAGETQPYEAVNLFNWLEKSSSSPMTRTLVTPDTIITNGYSDQLKEQYRHLVDEYTRKLEDTEGHDSENKTGLLFHDALSDADAAASAKESNPDISPG
ncbi:hypothetical protein Psal006b_02618 [Piscirickettsia salmonis]|uniref:Pentapeptide repeats family protein n=2 Tax=Piscirickettsia salmonis TaxID=1238 RepID=A0A1L6T9E0_PISSA|nr:hypothetical protein [Piscirickettsia salmonis]AKP73125.1 hypothetical protein PSLF89_1110 [Piscirickettsia salmonis LF-89 = ATCC VR-1361]ALB21782.1 pentapeptide repeats family protein [Piscirickettsia salmonis]ALY01967.1 hypothetical protein AWE47_03015 [Piscirickettsia salmonis]AMA41476.1 hypothetical protein AWJ11_03000 [Piscirickettsia salmonis]AOS33963.1 hypothetical protein AVM72_00255 [Piscirickettsia salmonis]